MTSLIISYDLSKDVENFIKSAHSTNNPSPTKLHRMFMSKYGHDFDTSLVRTFLSRQRPPRETIKRFRARWTAIEVEFFRRAQLMFDAQLPQEHIHAFVSTNDRCTYNIPGNYFFIYGGAESPNPYIMHELFHFFTWYALRADLIGQGFGTVQYNMIKEALTELLNLEFGDLMDGATDKGYPQHTRVRHLIGAYWRTSRNVRQVALETILKLEKEPASEST